MHFQQLMQKRQFGRILSDAVRYFSAEGRVSRLYLRTRWRLFFASKGLRSQFPEWLNEDFQNQYRLRDRWESQTQTPVAENAVRPEAQQAVGSSMWSLFFDGYDPGVTRTALEVRYPFFDLRLIKFMLGLPRLPWCSDKELLREAGRGALPDEVRLRRKSPLKADPLIALLKSPESAWVDRFEPLPEVERYVVPKRIPAVQGGTDSWTAWVNLRPRSLDFWLRGTERYGKNGPA
jgi:asparagine synthase (glutamine-hydrolysing)